MKWLYLGIAIIMEVIATSALKESNNFTKLLPSILVVIGYSFTFYFMSLTLRDMSVGITYAIWSGMGIFLISLIGYFRYNQTLDTPAILGMSFIALGIIILRFFSKSINA
jgi:small multidrug resistance pump|tara:strand:+ start:54 stop:383 length:330 start_codon:yes stop_codon:yes gene_type:complete